MIYVSIFKEKEHEYKKILDLNANDKVRDTFQSEILDIIAAYESGLADAIKLKRQSSIVAGELEIGLGCLNEESNLLQKYNEIGAWGNEYDY